MITLTKEQQHQMTPEAALDILREGNQRFVGNLRVNRNLLQQVNETSEGQFPFAAILSCIDSRTTAELIFDQGLGDIFSIRIAGNVVNSDIIGSLEFACNIAGSKLILVLGHTACGAVKGACDHAEMGHLTGLLNKIQPSVEEEHSISECRDGSNLDFVNSVAKINVLHSMQVIKKESDIIRHLLEEKRIAMVGGMYDVSTGEVTFIE